MFAHAVVQTVYSPSLWEGDNFNSNVTTGVPQSLGILTKYTIQEIYIFWIDWN